MDRDSIGVQELMLGSFNDEMRPIYGVSESAGKFAKMAVLVAMVAVCPEQLVLLLIISHCQKK